MYNSAFRMLSIYRVGLAGIWKAIPVGIALGASALETASFTALGSCTTMICLFYFGERVKRWVLRRWSNEKIEQRKERFLKIMNRYGIAGLGLLGRGLFGPITAIIVGLLTANPTAKLMPYLIAGIVFWSFLITYVSVKGLDYLKQLLL
jgi:membrane protein DedA with SNARE-associated domain